MTIKEIRALTGLSQSKFAAALHIPRRTIECWESEERKCPPYVLELIEYKVKADPEFQKAVE